MRSEGGADLVVGAERGGGGVLTVCQGNRDAIYPHRGAPVSIDSTHALLDGSPAIDRALNQSCPILDQRGFPRWDGSCDVIAYEAGADDPAIFTDGFESGTTSHWS